MGPRVPEDANHGVPGRPDVCPAEGEGDGVPDGERSDGDGEADGDGSGDGGQLAVLAVAADTDVTAASCGPVASRASSG